MAEIQKVRDHTWFEVRKGKDLYGASFCDPKRITTYQFDTQAQAKDVVKRLCEDGKSETFEFVVIKVHKKEVVVN